MLFYYTILDTQQNFDDFDISKQSFLARRVVCGGAWFDYFFVELFVLRLESGCLPLRPANTGRLPLKPVELLLFGLLGALKKLGPIDPLRCMDP